MRKAAIPSVYPREGAYNHPIHIVLSSAEPNSRVHYTLDGSEPTMDSPVFVKADGAIPLNGPAGEQTQCIVRAFAEADGLEPSRIVDFQYDFLRYPKTRYFHEILREPTKDTSGIIRIFDFDQEVMYLIIGTTRAILVDAGVENEGDLPGFCDELVGHAMPVDLFIGHGHPDHIAQAGNFHKAGKNVYMSHLEFPMIKNMGMKNPLDPECYIDVKEGDTFDIGNAVLHAYHVPGHTPGGMVLIDKKTGDLFASDAFGHQRRYQPDTLLMPGGIECSLESCLRSTEAFMEKTKDIKLTSFLSGHNDEAYDARSQVALFRDICKKGVEMGEAALEPSVRSQAESCGAGSIVMIGNYRLDPLWGGINVKFIYDADAVQDPPKYAPGYDDSMFRKMMEKHK